MRMPKALATVSAWALPVDGKLLVTRLELLTLTPAEEPHPFATGLAKREFVFNNSVHRRPTHGKAAAPTRDAKVGASAGMVSPLSDEQWQRLEPLLISALKPKGSAASGAPRAHTLRELIDAIRLKLGTPYPWSQLPVAPKCMQGATVLLSKLKRAGVWEKVVEAGNRLSPSPTLPVTIQ